MFRIAFIVPLLTAFICTAETQPYDKVITKEAVTSRGVFIVHKVASRYYYEIPTAELGKLFLWNIRIGKSTTGVGFGGAETGSRMVRWQLRDDKVLLRDVNLDNVAAADAAIAPAVKAANYETILMSFDVAALSEEGAPVIDVSRLFLSDLAESNIRQTLGATGFDPGRSFIDRISAYPKNVEAEAEMTWTRGENPPPLAGQMRPGSATVVVHHSMVRLPDEPMRARYYDDRVGFFTNVQYDYSLNQQRAGRRIVIARWRLEKKDAGAAVSDVVQPIVYYIDAATPVEWRDWIRRGVESWLPVLEAAGFRNAIEVKMAPEAGVDADFSPEDIRHSVIRWVPSTSQNAYGPTIRDPRSGEILNADIEFYHNIMTLARTWYFVQAGPLDARARTLPLPEAVMGRMIQYLIAHEVGHTLGLEHNMKASAMYPAEKLRDKEWLRTMGFTPSIMDYVRVNYVAQPEDGIPAEDLVPRVGPYDYFAIRWGYAAIAEARTPEEEQPVLDRWAREQDKIPWLRYTTLNGYWADPGYTGDVVGDGDPVRSAALGLKNLARVARMLIPATTARAGEPLDDLAEMYGVMLGQWGIEMGPVAALIGGVDAQTKHAGQSGPVFTPVAAARQKEALAFLMRNAFARPDWAIDAEIERRIEPTGVVGRIRSAQVAMLNNVLSAARFGRLVEIQSMGAGEVWPVRAFLGAVRAGIWSELAQPSVRVDVYRRNLQLAYLDIASLRINAAGGGDERAFYRAEMLALDSSLRTAMPRAANWETRAHLGSARDRIRRMLDPNNRSDQNR